MPRLLPAPMRTRWVLAALTGVVIAAAGCSATGTGTGTPSAPPTGSGPSSGAEQSSTAAAIPADSGPGVTPTTITVSYGGWLRRSSDDTAAGIKETAEADQAIVTAFNAEGSIDGRTVRLLPADQDPGMPLVKQRMQAFDKANGLPLPDPTNGTEVCDAYAHTPVFALLGSDLVDPPYETAASGACLNAAGHPIVGADEWSQADYQAAPATAGLALAQDHRVDALIAAGKDSGIIGPPGKIVIVTDATQPADASTADIAALAKAGVTDTQVIPVNPNLSQADALNLVVKLKASGATRVISLLGINTSYLFFGTMAPVLQQQQFYPRMLVLSDWDFNSLAPLGSSNVPAAVARRIALYSEDPSPLSTSRAQNETPAGKLCIAAAKAKPAVSDELIDGGDESGLCDLLELFRAVFAASGSSYVNAQAFTAGLNKLGTGYDSPELFRTDFDATHHDGAAGIVRETYSAKCHCSAYSDKVIPF